MRECEEMKEERQRLRQRRKEIRREKEISDWVNG
jgi:hypothetical protein